MVVGIGEDASGSISYLRRPGRDLGKGTMAEEPRMKPEFEPVESSPSVSVSVSSPPPVRETEAGLAERLNTLMVANSFVGKCTFFRWSMWGEDGSERVRG